MSNLSTSRFLYWTRFFEWVSRPLLRKRKTRDRKAMTVEQLEQRLAPAVFNWDGGGDGVSWTDAANWDSPGNNLLPGSADDAVINVAGNPTIEYTSGDRTIRSLTSQEAITVSGGSLTINENSTINGSFLITTGALTLNTMTLSGAGLLTNQGSLTVAASSIGNAVVNQGTLLAAGASGVTGALTAAAGSTLRVRGDDNFGNGILTVAQGFTNSGAIELTSITSTWNATLNVTNGTLVNAPGGTIDAMASLDGARWGPNWTTRARSRWALRSL